MKRLVLLLAAVGLLLAGCDSGGPARPEPSFEASAGPPVNASWKGTAALGDASSFEQGTLFTVTAPESDQTVTAIQLYGTDEAGVPHDLSFTYVADERLGPGTYELGSGAAGGGVIELGKQFVAPPDSLFLASYTRQTTDSLFTYPVGGTVTITAADADRVEGRFDLAAPVEVGVHRDSLRAYIDTLRDREGRPVPGEGPEPPRPSVQVLADSMGIDGRFVAAPGEFEDTMPSANRLFGVPLQP